MRVAVVGGAGGIGQVAAMDAARAPDVEAVRIVDVDIDRAREVSSRIGGDCAVEIRAPEDGDATFDETLAGCDVVVNAASHHLNMAVMRSCLAVGAHYVDLGGLFHVALEQLELDDTFASAGLSAAISLGTAPGITNMLAAVGAERMSQVSAIEVVDVLIAGENGPLESAYVAPYAPATLISEFADPAVMLIDGSFQTLPAASGAKLYMLPEGEVECVYTLHSEPATLARSFEHRGIRHVEWRLGLPAQDVQRLRAFISGGLTSSEPIDVDGVAVSPRQVLTHTLERQRRRSAAQAGDDDMLERLFAHVSGIEDGEPVKVAVKIAIVRQPEWEFDAGTYATGVAPMVAALMIGRGLALRHGVGGPESMLPTEEFFAELASRGIAQPVLERTAVAQSA